MIEEVIDAGGGVVRCEHRKVAIVGAGPGRDRAPYDAPDWCVWALNEIHQKRFDRHFELHPMSVQSDQDLTALALIHEPTYVLDLEEARSRVLNPVQYPLDRIRAAFPRAYFTCTFAYQIALALLDGVEEIGLYGMSLFRGTPRERLAERACVDYWIGFAEGRGVRIVEDSRLATQDPLYGYDYSAEVRYVDAEVARFVGVAHDEDARQKRRCWFSVAYDRAQRMTPDEHAFLERLTE